MYNGCIIGRYTSAAGGYLHIPTTYRSRKLTDIITNDNGMVIDLDTAFNQFKLKKGTYRFSIRCIDSTAGSDNTVSPAVTKRGSTINRLYNVSLDAVPTTTYVNSSSSFLPSRTPLKGIVNGNVFHPQTITEMQGVFSIDFSAVFAIQVKGIKPEVASTVAMLLEGFPPYDDPANAANIGTIIELEKVA